MAKNPPEYMPKKKQSNTVNLQGRWEAVKPEKIYREMRTIAAKKEPVAMSYKTMRKATPKTLAGLRYTEGTKKKRRGD